MSQFLNKLDVRSEKRHNESSPKTPTSIRYYNKQRCVKTWTIKPEAWKSEDERKEPDNVLIEDDDVEMLNEVEKESQLLESGDSESSELDISQYITIDYIDYV